MVLDEQRLKRIEENMDKMEKKLRVTFQEIENRFEELKTQPAYVEERIQELEDLMLLMQLEITKIKEKISVSTDFLTPNTEGLEQRVARLEEAISMNYAVQDEIYNENYEPEEVYGIGTEEDAPVSVKEILYGDEKKYLEEEKDIEIKQEERPTQKKSLLEDVQKILMS